MRRAVAGVLLLAAGGCGGPTTFPVSGRVHFADGTPLPIGRVTVRLPGGLGASGWLHADGTFDLGTQTATDGLPPGTYPVAIDNAVTPPPAGYAPNFVSKPLIHPKYANPDTSGLVFEVPATRVWDITVEKP